MQIIAAAVPVITTLLTFAAQIITGVLVPAIQIILKVVQIVFPIIMAVISTAMTLITGIIKTATALLQGDWSAAWSAIKETATTIMNNIISFFEGIDLVSAGKDIIQGLIDGIGSMVGKAVSKVKEVAGSIKDAVTGFFDINSPSRVFRDEVGMMLGAGMIVGMDRSQSGVTKAAQSMADAAMVDPASSTTRYGVNPAGTAGRGGISSRSSVKIEKGAIVISGTDKNGAAIGEELLAYLYDKLSQADEILSTADVGGLLYD